MASFIFEEGTQANAASFVAGDTLVFKSATATGLDVTFTPASGLNGAAITLTSGTTSLTFGAGALTDASTDKIFLSGGGTLIFGDANANTTSAFNVTGADASAAYLLGGADSILVSGTGAHVIDLGAGIDSVLASGSGAFVLQGGDGGDSIDASGATGNLHIYGNVVGAAGLTDGNDTIILGSTSGTDSIGSSYVNGNAGDDSIFATAGVNRLNGGAGADTIVGGSSIDSINGNLGNDSISGGGGNDYLRGGQGNDIIVAGAGNSQLFGDLGNDSLVAGNGINVLTGGAGNDVFSFVTTGSAALPATTGAFAGFVSEIKDFAAGTDKIDIAGVTGTTTTNTILVQAAGATFTTESAARTYAQQLLDSANATTAQSTTVHYTAAIQVGADTYLYSSNGTSTDLTAANNATVLKLDAVTASTIKSADII